MILGFAGCRLQQSFNDTLKDARTSNADSHDFQQERTVSSRLLPRTPDGVEILDKSLACGVGMLTATIPAVFTPQTLGVSAVVGLVTTAAGAFFASTVAVRGVPLPAGVNRFERNDMESRFVNARGAYDQVVLGREMGAYQQLEERLPRARAVGVAESAGRPGGVLGQVLMGRGGAGRAKPTGQRDTTWEASLKQ